MFVCSFVFPTFAPPANRSPARRGTVTGAGVSPPKGFHSWLAASGLTVIPVSNPTSVPATNNTNVSNPTAEIHTHVNAIASNAPIVSSSKPAQKNKTVGFIDLSHVDDVVKETAKLPEPAASSKDEKAECDEEGIDSNGLVALSEYFEKKMKGPKGYIPLTVFNTQWLKQDLVQQTFRNRTTKEKINDIHVGMTVPVEWKMTFGEWVVAFDLFVAYLRFYNHGPLASNFVIHKSNVMEIKKENFNWPMAFRYNIAIRTTVMTVRNTNGKLANPAKRNEMIERTAFRDTERFGDFLPAFNDINPYADGCAKANFNPITGEDLRNVMFPQNLISSSSAHVPQPNLHVASNPFGAGLYNLNFTAPSKPNARSWAHSNQPVYNGPGGVSYGQWEDRRSTGRNVRGRGRGGGYGRDNSPPPRRFAENSRRGEGSGSWRREDRRDDRHNDDRDHNGGKHFNGNGKAK